MAALRNLCNLVSAGVSRKTIDKIAAKLGDADEVRNSRQLPFRFLAAANELDKYPFNSTHIARRLTRSAKSYEVSLEDSVRRLAGFFGSCLVRNGSSGRKATIW